jgi:hypothetical protein
VHMKCIHRKYIGGKGNKRACFVPEYGEDVCDIDVTWESRFLAITLLNFREGRYESHRVGRKIIHSVCRLLPDLSVPRYMSV